MLPYLSTLENELVFKGTLQMSRCTVTLLYSIELWFVDASRRRTRDDATACICVGNWTSSDDAGSGCINVAGDVTCSLLVERGACTDASSSTLRFVRERCTLACGFCTSSTVTTTTYTTSTATTTASATTTTTTNNYDNASPDSGTTYVYVNSTHYMPPCYLAPSD